MSLVYLNSCRLCAASCENFVSIFEKSRIWNLAEKIKSYLHVEIKNPNDTNDDPKMCNSCYKRIMSWDRYAEQVKKVQGMFMLLTDMEDNKAEVKLSSKTKEVGEADYNLNQPTVKIETGETTEQNAAAMHDEDKCKKRGEMKKQEAETHHSDFSDDDDDIPTTNQMDTLTDDLKIRLSKEKEKKKIKPKIKLKIKPLKRQDEIKTEKIEEVEDVDDAVETNSAKGDDGLTDGLNSKDENLIEMNGVSSLFKWECLECHAPVKNWNALVKHCKDVHESSASVQCICGKLLQSRASIVKHRMKHTVGYGYKCEYENCNKTFHRQQLLDVHSLSHMPKELQPWMCCKCSRRFHTESLLKQHEKVHLPKEEKLIHPCEVCQKKFCSKSAVASHIRAVHFGERPFVCDQCGHSFTSKGILHEHLTIHSDVYNFHCKDCNKSFKTKYRLKIHMDTHMETRYQCPVCTLTLNTRRTLRMHLLVHRDDKAFQCTTCGKAFKRSKDLKNHYNLHTGRRPYTCPFCQRTFANGSNCRSHKRRMHPEELKEYEAALAAGQKPATFRGEGQDTQDRSGMETMEDSNDSKSDMSDLKYDYRKYSDEDDKPVSMVPYLGKFSDGEAETQFKSKFDLHDDCNPIKLEDEDEEEDAMDLNEESSLASSMTQNPFGSQEQNVEYSPQNFYSFQSSGIPAFPGNPFFRQ